ncbi:acetyltransferase [Paenibacillus sp. GYB003]|uniref:acetyltransferase n=1 Tax=Paenibacillus sp. GYB003 TaxID=2994392 RepID=UPI002F96703B
MANNIVAYEEKDHDALVSIWHRAVRGTHDFLSEDDIAFYYDIVKNGALRDVELWVERNGEGVPIGFIGLQDDKIEMLFVDPEYHGRGAGSRLIRHAESLKGSKLKVDVNEQNEKAYAFYVRQGFVKTGRSELDGSGRPFPLVHMER